MSPETRFRFLARDLAILAAFNARKAVVWARRKLESAASGLAARSRFRK